MQVSADPLIFSRVIHQPCMKTWKSICLSEIEEKTNLSYLFDITNFNAALHKMGKRVRGCL